MIEHLFMEDKMRKKEQKAHSSLELPIELETRLRIAAALRRESKSQFIRDSILERLKGLGLPDFEAMDVELLKGDSCGGTFCS